MTRANPTRTRATRTRARRAVSEPGESREGWAILVAAVALLAALALASYRTEQVPFLTEPPSATNWTGPVGAHVAFALVYVFGVVAALSPVLLAWGAVELAFPRMRSPRRWFHVGLVVASLAAIVQMHPDWVDRLSSVWAGGYGAGGFLGWALADKALVRLLNVPGAHIVAIAALAVGLVGVFHLRPLEWGAAAARWIGSRIRVIREGHANRLDLRRGLRRQARELDRRKRSVDREVSRSERAAGRTKGGRDRRDETADTDLAHPARPIEIGLGDGSAAVPESAAVSPPKPAPKRRERAREKPAAAAAAAARPTARPSAEGGTGDSAPASAGEPIEYLLPPIDLLDLAEESGATGSTTDIQEQATTLQQTLREFGIDATVNRADRGPVITRFEITPAPGVKVERISALSNNIALALKATSVRILAPIPGKGAVGVEVPNSTGSVVRMRGLMNTREWTTGKAKLPLAIGKDVSGKTVIADLSTMPHLLVAGATGSGKTICVNSMLVSLLYRHTPEDLRLILVDPKIVEMSGYGRLPHLVMPVMTETKKIPLALRWAIKEMESRYQTLARVGVRNIAGFNERDVAADPVQEPNDDRPPVPAKLPYIVVIIDELADIMQTSRPEVEGMIARLAQLSRAVGIHMIIATQRPSVDVLTGVIKANFPARIAFQVASKVDSRTILDSSGADKLLGRGDLLFLPPGSSKLIRAQGTFASDEEIKRLVDFWGGQGEPVYVPQAIQSVEQVSTDVSDADEQVVDDAVEVIRQSRRASVSLLQRRLRIGYTRAARVMDILEERGIVGPGKGAEPREILIDFDGEVPDMSDA